MNLLILIKNYERELENLKWDLETNSENYNKYKIEKIEIRIHDRENFIRDLKRLL